MAVFSSESCLCPNMLHSLSRPAVCAPKSHWHLLPPPSSHPSSHLPTVSPSQLLTFSPSHFLAFPSLRDWKVDTLYIIVFFFEIPNFEVHSVPVSVSVPATAELRRHVVILREHVSSPRSSSQHFQSYIFAYVILLRSCILYSSS